MCKFATETQCKTWCITLIFVAQTACVLSHFCCVQLFVILCAVARQAPLSMGFSRQEYWSGLPCPPPGDLPPPRESNPHLSHLLHRQADSLPLAPPGKELSSNTPSTHSDRLASLAVKWCHVLRSGQWNVNKSEEVFVDWDREEPTCGYALFLYEGTDKAICCYTCYHTLTWSSSLNQGLEHLGGSEALCRDR